MRGLDRCWMADQGLWSFRYHLDGRSEPNESLPSRDGFYSLNVLLGFSRVKNASRLYGTANSVDFDDTFDRAALSLLKSPVPVYSYGMALWASAEMRRRLPSEVECHIKKFIENQDNWLRFSGQDLGMIISGVVAQMLVGNGNWSKVSHELFAFLRSNYSCSSGLFFNQASGVRRRFASFATQTYLTMACYHYGDWAQDDRAIALANSCVSRLMSLQGPDGEWPWFFYTPTGEVVDFYDVYSVHQDGMAPAFLECAKRHGVPGTDDSRDRGFLWICGQNQLRRSMLVPELGLIIRSQLRPGEYHSSYRRAIRAGLNVATGKSSRLIRQPPELRLECRSYHLGWILWSFGKQSDVPQLTHHPAFQAETYRSAPT